MERWYPWFTRRQLSGERSSDSNVSLRIASALRRWDSPFRRIRSRRCSSFSSVVLCRLVLSCLVADEVLVARSLVFEAVPVARLVVVVAVVDQSSLVAQRRRLFGIANFLTHLALYFLACRPC